MSLKPRPHAEVIKAFADGHTVQVWDAPSNRWYDIHPISACPPFSGTSQYRVKPPTKKYRVALWKHGPVTTVREDMAKFWETSSSDFIRWLTDWIEYEV